MEFLPFNSMTGFPYIPQEYAAYPPQVQAQAPLPQFALLHRTSLPALPRTRLQNPGKTESKPRLTKEERDVLEAEFRKTYKPSSATKKELAEALKLDRVKVDTWFQNRRAKAKQEKKLEQKAEEARLAQLKEHGDVPSAEEADGKPAPLDAPRDDTQSAPATRQPSEQSRLQEPEPADATSTPSTVFTEESGSNISQPGTFIPSYEDPTTASLQSLDRVMASVRQAKSAEELHDHSVGMHPGFDSSLPFGCFTPEHIPQDPMSHAFDMPVALNGSMAEEHGFAMAGPRAIPVHHGNMIHMNHLASASMNAYLMPENATTQFANMEPLPELYEQAGATPTSNLLPPQMLPQSSSGMPEPETTSFAAATHEQHGEALGQPHFSLKSPPPPSNLATRRSKPRPAALVPAALLNHGHNGPRTFSYSETKRGPMSPVRRMFSNNVSYNRIQKSSSNLSQRAHVNFQALDAEFMGQNAQMKMPLSAGLPLSSGTMAPPTPLSPRVLRPQRERSTSATPSHGDSRTGFVFEDGYMGMQGEDGDQNLASPPETPHHLLNQPEHMSTWQWDALDQPLHTPAADSFTSSLHMPEPQYISPSSGSQPNTPGFGSVNFLYGPSSPQVTAFGGMPNAEFQYPVDFATCFGMQSGKSSPVHGKQTVYTFNVTTPAEFKTTK